jgi:methionyl aminopeptidase
MRLGTHLNVLSPQEMDRMRASGRLLGQVFEKVLAAVVPEATTADLDRIAYEAITEAGAKPAFLNYRGFPATICASVDEEIVHGIPNHVPLREGQIVGIDMGLILNDFYSDRATTMPVGGVLPEVARLLRVTQECLRQGIAAARVGQRLQDIGRAIQTLAEGEGFGVVREYSGHCIGRQLHEEPQIPNFVGRETRGPNPRLVAGMAMAIEPMINQGTWKTRILDDRWTVVTADGFPSAHFEHTILVTEAGPEILTGEHPSLQEMELDTE